MVNTDKMKQQKTSIVKARASTSSKTSKLTSNIGTNPNMLQKLANMSPELATTIKQGISDFIQALNDPDSPGDLGIAIDTFNEYLESLKENASDEDKEILQALQDQLAESLDIDELIDILSELVDKLSEEEQE